MTKTLHQVLRAVKKSGGSVKCIVFTSSLAATNPEAPPAVKSEAHYTDVRSLAQIRVWDSSGRSVFSLDSRNRAHPFFASNGELRSFRTHFLFLKMSPRIHLILT